jgi:hypothetical protein
VTRNNRRVKRVKLDKPNILAIFGNSENGLCSLYDVKVATPLVLSHTELMGLVDEKTVKQIFGDLFDAPTSDEVVKECKVTTLCR